ncbi:MAG: phage portal protein [Ruminococcus sp.]|nr:phage portal protein [Ruminococcus sp.]
MEYGLPYLRRKLGAKRTRVLTRYAYYDMKVSVTELSSILPKEFGWLAYSLGWCAKAVDSVADRIVFDKFSNDDFGLNEIFKLNNSDVFLDDSVLSALISSCSFIYIGQDESGYPTMQVIDGSNATGTIDPVTKMLTEGYAVLERDEYSRTPILEAYFRPYQTDYYVRGRLDESLTFVHKAPYALLVPIINRPDAKRPFGHSRISRTCMHITQAVLRTFRRMDVSAEFYSFPQKYILGLSDDAEFNNRAATMSSFLSIGKGEDGDKPTVGQFQQQSMTPYAEQLKAYASVFAGETGLTLDDLGFTTDNPASYDAIRASHESLRLTSRKAQRTIGVGYLNAGYLSACVRDNFEYDRRAFANTIPEWLPIFEPDAAALGAAGDAIFKINQAAEGFFGAGNIHRLTGLESDNV